MTPRLVPVPTCGNCQYFAQGQVGQVATYTYGRCLRYPPAIEGLFPLGALVSWEQRWPSVLDALVCGEHKEKQ